MIMKLGLKNLKSNAFMSVLIILQMIVVFFIIISMTSTVVSRFQYYTPIKELLNSNSYYYYIHNGYSPETGSAWTNTSDFSKLIENEKEIYATYNAWLEYDNNGTLESINTISYDDEFIQLYKPELESGKWFETDYANNNLLPVVVSQNNYGLNVGDIVSLTCSETNEQISAYIVGKLRDGTKVLDYTIANNQKMNCTNMYKNYFIDIEEKPLFIMPQKYLENENIVTQLSGPLIITYNNEASNSEINDNDSIVKNMMTLSAATTNEIKSNSIEYIFEQVQTLLPILISIFIMVLVSAISVSALSAKRQLKNYAVFYICGLKWRDCALINIASATISVIIAMEVSICGITIFKNIFLSDSVIQVGFFQLISCIGIALIYIILSALLPLQIISNNTPREILKSN